MRKKLAGIHLLAPLSETDIVNYSRNLDRELIVNSTIVTDGIVDTVEKTNYIVTFEYDTTLDGGTHQIRRSIPTLELLSYTGENMSGAHWVNVEDMDYNYITSGTTAQQAFEELDEQLSKLTYFKHIVDSVGIGSVVSANDDKVPQSVVSDGNFLIVLGDSHNVSYANNSVIIGGIQSIIQGDNDSDIARSGSVDPDGYTIQYAAIVGGYRNYIYGNADYASIFGGDKNQIIDNSLHGSILGGAVNKLYGYNDLSCIISGVNSYIYGSNVDKARGGIFQSVTSKLIDSMDTVIIGGVDSILTNSDQASSIGSVSIDALYSNTVFFGGSKGVKTANAYASSVISSNGPSRTLVHRNTSNTSMIGASGCEMLGANNASIISSNGCVVSGEYVGYDTGNNLSTMYASVKIVSLGYPNTVNVDDVTKFSIGLNVIYNPLWRNVPMASIYVKTIDSVNNRVSFIKSDGSDFIFDNVGANDYILIPYYQSTEYTILSNTTDTFSFASPVNLYGGLVILPDYSPERLTVVNVSGYTTIKLKLVSTNEYITVPNNAYSGKKLIRYAEPGYSLGTSIIASNGSYISHSSSAVLLAANGCHITNTDSASSIIASGGSYITDSYQSIINGGGGNHITNARNAIIIGGDTNYILDCKVIDDAPLITTTMIGTINCHIMNSNIAIILNSDSSYIEKCTRRTEDDSSPIGAYMLGTRFSTINDSEGCGIIGGKDNHIISGIGNTIIGGANNIAQNANYTVMIACDTKTADRDYALFTDSITLTDSKLVLKTGTGLGTYKVPSVGDVLMVESVGYGDPNIWGEVANLTWGKAKGGNDMTPIDINSSLTSISNYNTDPSKVVYFFNCDTFNTNTGSYYKTFYINNETMYPIGTIIYIILYKLASLANNTHGLSVGCGSTTYGFSSDSGNTSECRTVAFQKVNASEWIILSNK